MSDEPIYTQQDIDIARNAAEKFKSERDDAYRVVWAMVKALGGSFGIPEKYLVEHSEGSELTTYKDFEKSLMVIEAK